MDDQRDLPEGVRITGASEAGPAGAAPQRVPGSAPGPDSRSASWGGADDEEVWDDAWLAADGDLDGHAPAPAASSARSGHDDDTHSGDSGLWGDAAGAKSAPVPTPAPTTERIISIDDDDADDDGRSSWRTYTRSTLRDDAVIDEDEGIAEDAAHDDFDDEVEIEVDDELDDEAAVKAAGLRAAVPGERGGRALDEDDAEIDDSFGPRGNDLDLDDDDDDAPAEPAPRSRRAASLDDPGDPGDPTARRRQRPASSRPARGARPGAASTARDSRPADARGGAEPAAPGSRRPGERPAAPRQARQQAPVVASSSGRRVATGLALAFVAAVILKALDKPGAILLLTAAGGVGAYELVTSMRQRGFGPAVIPVIVSVAIAPLAAYRDGVQGLVVLSILTVLVTMLWYLVGPVRDRPTANIAVSLLAFAYLGWAVSLAAVIVAGQPLERGSHGIAVLVGVIVGCAAHDIGALFVGKNFGRLPIAPEVSPNKTLEGLLGGVVGVVLAGGLFADFVEPFKGDTGALVFFVLVLAVLAPLGDLVESMLKRDLDRKDMGSILPGHGGVLDRIDAMVFVLPAVYLLALYKHWV